MFLPFESPGDTVRFLTTTALLFAAVLSCGCRARSTTLQCERETALLRAEILDLEDKYYALKSQHESSPVAGSTMVANAGYVGSGVVSSHTSPVYIDSQGYGTPMVHGEVIHSEVIHGDVIYEDQMIPQGIHYGTQVLPGTVVPFEAQSTEPSLSTPEGESIYQDQAEPASPETGSVGAQVDDMTVADTKTPKPDKVTSDPDDLTLPDDDLDLEMEVGYEDLDLALDSESQQIDRLEIVPAATRGKDLDGVPGHDGIELMVKTVNSDGEFVEHLGAMTITVEDPLAGEIGKWTFLPQELRLFLSRDELGNMGTLLHLPWTGKIPVSQKVEIRVSVMIDNVEYIATHRISIEPPTGGSTPAIVGWGDDNRWVSAPHSSRTRIDNHAPTLPAKGYSGSQNFSSPPRFQPSRPQASIERPQWKPVR